MFYFGFFVWFGRVLGILVCSRTVGGIVIRIETGFRECFILRDIRWVLFFLGFSFVFLVVLVLVVYKLREMVILS